MQMRKKVIMITNILLICTMVVHIGIRMYLHSLNPMNSAPTYAVLFEAVYYLIPILIINVINLFFKNK